MVGPIEEDSANMCNASFAAGVLPASQKHAIVKPGLKKPTLDSRGIMPVLRHRIVINL